MAKSKEELVRILKSNIKNFNKYREETNFENLDLSGADLTGTNLCRARLDNVILKDAELNFAYLHSADLKNSDLSDLTVGRADMTEADLTGATINGGDLTNTILYGANLTKVKAHNMVLEGAKVREVNFTEADLTQANLSNLDLNGVNFSNAILKGTDFTGSNLSNALNLGTCKHDETTLWPDSSSMPSDFNPDTSFKTTPLDFNAIQEESSLNLDYGPGIASEQEEDFGGSQDYEFLDIPQHSTTQDNIASGSSMTELESPFSKPEETDKFEDFDELPDFEQFTFEEGPQHNDSGLPEFEDSIQQVEPGLAIDESGLMEPLGGLEDLSADDRFSSSLSSSFDGISQNKLSQPDGIGSITSQEFPVGLGSSLDPAEDLLSSKHHHPASTPASPPAPAPPPPTPVPAPTPAPTQPSEVSATTMSTGQMDAIMSALGGITQKLNHIEREQKRQRSAIEDLQKSSNGILSSEMLTHKLEDLSAATRSIFSRIESKIDIIAQTDPLDQMDSLLGELADSMRNEQEKH